MLSSIHPLGERARQSKWGLTVAAYVAASALAGTAFGALLGLLGSVVDGSTRAGGWVVAVVVVAGLGGALADLGVGGLRVPSLASRQVNDRWLTAYRGWVYGAGFGFQLGLGVATFVTTAAVYATWLLALLSASPLSGGLIGAGFGAVRGAVLLTMGGVRDPAALRAAHRRIEAWAVPARRLAAGGQAGLAIIVAAGAVL